MPGGTPVFKRLSLLLFFVLLLAGAYAAYTVLRPQANYEKEAFVDIEPGTSTRGIAQKLADAGVIASEWPFLVVRFIQPGKVLQAGEYHFDQPMSPFEVYGKIARGEIYYRELRVPEGASMFDIAEIVEKLGFIKGSEFLKVARDPALIRDLAPGAPSLEGFLFPSTYRVTRRTTAQQVAREMTNEFRRVWKEVGKPGLDLNRTVTLASLVEKETAVPSERRTVASVYKNRLDIGMKLDCDPTTIYAARLEDRWDGVIHRSDLDSPNPYNTYRNPGLPPGAIANPGAESLRAAMDPADTRYLFFVAKPGGSGEHVFTESIDQHNAAVQSYRRGVAQ
jgi:UPF0755 protein